MSWEEFEELEGCQTGFHSKEKEKVELWSREAPETIEPVVKKNKVSLEELTKKAEEEEKFEYILMKDKDGKFRCGNGGCTLVYTEEENVDDCCSYHEGTAIFRDIQKFWSCCPTNVAYEFEDFLALPTCKKGKHIYKYKKKKIE